MCCLFFSVKSPFKWRYKCCLSGVKGDINWTASDRGEAETRFFLCFRSRRKDRKNYLEISSFLASG